MIEGHIEFESEAGEIKLNLDQDNCQEIVHVCADMIVKQSATYAEALKKSAVDINLLDYDEA